MVGLIRESDISDVRDRVDLADLIGERVQLKNSGGRLKGLCPFHDEKTPSFNVNPTLNVYICFGCGESGDAITFLRKIDHLGFVEAIETLAQRVNITLTYEDDPGGLSAENRAQNASVRSRVLAANRTAAAWFQARLNLPDAQSAREQLASRGFDQQAALTYGCGYSPDTWDALVQHLQSNGYTEQEITTANLATQGQRGLIDRFRNRLMWPIRDMAGETIGFGARKLSSEPEDKTPKYYNTAETPVYKKSQVLYGIDLAKRDIAKKRQVVIVEGYTDVMSCHLAGVTTAVATCGTAFGSEHINVIRRLLDDSRSGKGEIIYLFDGDSAGQKAAMKAFEDDQKFIIQTYVAVTPNNMDPCELRLSEGNQAVMNLVASRVPLIEFVVKTIIAQYDLSKAEGRIGAIKECAPVVAKIKDFSLMVSYPALIAEWTHSDEQTVRDIVAQETKTTARVKKEEITTRMGAAKVDQDIALRNEREVLKLAIQTPEIMGSHFDSISIGDWSDPNHAALALLVAQNGGTVHQKGDAAWLRRLLEVTSEELKPLVTTLAVEPPNLNVVVEAYAITQIKMMRQAALRRKIDDAFERERQAKEDGDLILRNEIMKERVALTQAWSELRGLSR